MENQVKMHAAAYQTVKVLPACHNSYVKIQDEQLYIHYRNQRYEVGVDKIAKFYLQKKKAHSWIPGVERFFFNPKYTLCLKTCDSEKITMVIRASDKQYFINAIYTVRNIKQKF